MKKIVVASLLSFVGLAVFAQGYTTGAMNIVARQNASNSIANYYTDPCINAGNCARSSTNYSVATGRVTGSSAESAISAKMKLLDQLHATDIGSGAGSNYYSNPLYKPTPVPIKVSTGSSVIGTGQIVTKPATIAVVAEQKPLCASYGLNAAMAAQKRSQGICR